MQDVALSTSPSAGAEERQRQQHLELLIQFDGLAEDVSSTIKSLRQLSAVDHLTIVAERDHHVKCKSTSVSNMTHMSRWA
jgi:hypothetical protein